MMKLISRLQKDMDKLSQTIHKEGFDLIERLKLRENLETRRKDLEHLVESTLKKFEPSYQKFLKDLTVNAKKAGVDISGIEKRLRNGAKTLGVQLKSTKKKATTAKSSSAKPSTKPAAAKPKAKSKSTKKKAPTTPTQTHQE